MDLLGWAATLSRIPHYVEYGFLPKLCNFSLFSESQLSVTIGFDQSNACIVKVALWLDK